MSLRLRIQDLRPLDPAPPLPDRLVTSLREAVEKGSAPAVAIVARQDATHLVALGEAAKAGVRPGRLLAGLSTARFDDDPALPEAIGVMGRFELRRRGEKAKGAPMAQVFLEWADCSWWHWRALLSADGEVLDDTVTVRSARAGDPLPAQLGRWWSAGRRHRLSMHLRRVPAVPITTSEMVH